MERRKVFVILYITKAGAIVAVPATFRDKSEASIEAEKMFNNLKNTWFIAQAVDPK